MPQPTAWKYLVLRQGDFEFPVIIPETLDIDVTAASLRLAYEGIEDAKGVTPKPMNLVSCGYIEGLTMNSINAVSPEREHRPEDAILLTQFARDLGFRPKYT